MLEKAISELRLRGKIKRLLGQSKQVARGSQEFLANLRLSEINAKEANVSGRLDDFGNLVKISIEDLLVRDVGNVCNGQV